ncbi:putative sulfate exporter family transporter [Quadrisphaera sp. INWT6]|uniref:YeiH family protein n=1 Tax=Quadrisphaera sp. INWT6 TaxID=2596917 RepID=UPI001DB578B3|nr:putative sulfate exporter family transporter [Quadrisphaera sp. INWT6]MBF5082938.1 putative sulfate exporter family transporter [Quadrisphaera sp. INWT6]
MTAPTARGAAASARHLAPGLLAAAVATAVAFTASRLVPGLGPTTVAVVLGLLVANAGLQRPALAPGTAFASRRLLRTAVVLLGLQLPLSALVALGWEGLAVVVGVVVATFAGTLLLGRALGVSPARSLLVSTGFSICGASAIAAVEPLSKARKDDVSTAVALVTLCGSLAILVLPPLRGPLGLDPVAFGAWTGASVHDVGQVVATASRVDGALQTAVVVKLARVAVLAPLVAVVGLAARRAALRSSADGDDGDDGDAGAGPAAGRRTPLLPLFVVGFLVAAGVRTAGVLPAGALEAAQLVQTVLLVAALYALGTGIRLGVLVRTGGRSLVLGLTSWVLVAGLAYAGVRLLGL